MRPQPIAHTAAGPTMAGQSNTDHPVAKNGANHPAEAIDHIVPTSAPNSHPGCFQRALNGAVTTVLSAPVKPPHFDSLP